MHKNEKKIPKVRAVDYLAYKCFCLGIMTSISINYFCWQLKMYSGLKARAIPIKFNYFLLQPKQ